MVSFIPQSFKILGIFPENNLLEFIENIARVSHMSHNKTEPGSAKKLLSIIIKNNHNTILEFGEMIVEFLTDRGNTHELVRHRIASFNQTSTRFVDYKKKQLDFIKPVWLKDMSNESINVYIEACQQSQDSYLKLLGLGWKPQQARCVLNHSIASNIVIKANLREWKHIFKLRTAPDAHPQIKSLMTELLIETKKKIPLIFDDINLIN